MNLTLVFRSAGSLIEFVYLVQVGQGVILGVGCVAGHCLVVSKMHYTLLLTSGRQEEN